MRKLPLFILIIIVLASSSLTAKDLFYCNVNTNSTLALRLGHPTINKFILDFQWVLFSGYFVDDKCIFKLWDEDITNELVVDFLKYEPKDEIQVLVTLWEMEDGVKEKTEEKLIKYNWKPLRDMGDSHPLITMEVDNTYVQGALDLINQAFGDLSDADKEYKFNAYRIAEKVVRVVR